jgi:hypothetical protein
VAARLARFHADHGLGAPSPFSPEAWLEAVSAPMRHTLESLESAPAGLVEERAQQVELADDANELAARLDQWERVEAARVEERLDLGEGRADRSRRPRASSRRRRGTRGTRTPDPHGTGPAPNQSAASQGR